MEHHVSQTLLKWGLVYTSSLVTRTIYGNTEKSVFFLYLTVFEGCCPFANSQRKLRKIAIFWHTFGTLWNTYGTPELPIQASFIEKDRSSSPFGCGLFLLSDILNVVCYLDVVLFYLRLRDVGVYIHRC